MQAWLTRAGLLAAAGLPPSASPSPKLGAEYMSSAALGPDGYLFRLGFVPLPADEMLEAMTLAKTMAPVRREALPD